MDTDTLQNNTDSLKAHAHQTRLQNSHGVVYFAQDDSQRRYYISRQKLVSTVVELLTKDEPALRKSKADLNRENTRQEVLAVSANSDAPLFGLGPGFRS